MHPDSILREQSFYWFRPFDEAIGPGIKIILITNVIRFLQFVYPVKVKMKEGIARMGSVFIDDRKRRTLNNIRSPQVMTDGFDEGGFPRSHFTIKSEDTRTRERPQQFQRRRDQVRFCITSESQFMIYD